jgi:hypothetical protein
MVPEMQAWIFHGWYWNPRLILMLSLTVPKPKTSLVTSMDTVCMGSLGPFPVNLHNALQQRIREVYICVCVCVCVCTCTRVWPFREKPTNSRCHYLTFLSNNILWKYSSMILCSCATLEGYVFLLMSILSGFSFFFRKLWWNEHPCVWREECLN